MTTERSPVGESARGRDGGKTARSARGYTLMEVLIAVALLAVVLTVVLGTQANQVQIGSTANEMGTAMLLGRAKMLEIESGLLADGFSDDEQNEKGDFRSEGFAAFHWESRVEPVKIDDASKEQLLGEANSKLFGEGESGDGGTFTGNDAFASYLPMVVGLLPDYINKIGERARKVTLTITWETLRGEQQLSIVQYVSNADADDEGEEGIAPPLDPGADLLNPLGDGGDEP